MANLFIISDTHFLHTNIIKYCDRPFVSMEEMNKVMIRNWNNKVEPEDWVLHGGDWSYGRDAKPERIKEIRKQCNGNIILCRGNHDSKLSANKWINYVGMQFFLNKHMQYLELGNYVFVYLKGSPCEDLKKKHQEWWNKKVIYISHVPIRGQVGSPYYWGHEHNNLSIEQEMEYGGRNVGVERMHYSPLFLGELVFD